MIGDPSHWSVLNFPPLLQDEWQCSICQRRANTKDKPKMYLKSVAGAVMAQNRFKVGTKAAAKRQDSCNDVLNKGSSSGLEVTANI